MTDDVDIPKVGPVDKKVVIAIGVSVAAFVGFRYWQDSRSVAGSDEETGSTLNSEFDESGDPGTVLGAVRPNNDYGVSDSQSGPDSASTDDFGFRGTTNDAWTQYASAQLSQSDRWSYTDVVEALGNYLAQKPTSATQQTIVNAAIAVAGRPPVGTFTLVSGGNTPLTIKPTVTKVETDTTTAKIYFTPVAGAASYKAYRGTGSNVGSGTGSPLTVSGLQPNTTYDFSVRGVTASGANGPQSATMKGKTKAVSMAVPKTPTVSAISKTTATFSVPAVAGATGYNWYLNGHSLGHSDNPTWPAKGLRSKTKYSVSVQADNATQAPTAKSPAKSFTTK